ncbi:MAG: hypothetical protein LUD27_08790 [Clostridia bacterium]|nr:hypothetical protein [Clostridia bacterium]
MKKLLTTLSIALLTVVLCVAFAGCTTNVSGKTYNYDEVVAESDEDLPGLGQAVVSKAKELVEEAFEGATLTFNEDGTLSGKVSSYSAGYWGQEGKNVSLYATSEMTTALLTFTVSGSKLVLETTQEGFAFSVKFVKA